ncbi:MFS glucose transporter mfs1 [Pseudocercospora fuligena]|uniref:MFS glucose transporter mfs1 n=1 Tax=Pseudocercospora fuligena TaxID=685502 RepID=A0A8H6R8Q2_9PEZI|nr:MFS glucose transporter mfs1 [Pseudocercospora fuligena]
MHRPSAYNILIALAATMGSLTYGYTNAILGGTLTKASFFEYMKLDPTGPGARHVETIETALNGVVYGGGFLAMWASPVIADKFGRLALMRFAGVIGVIGAGLQAGSVSTTMLIIARLVAGAAMGICAGTVPTYQAEIAPPMNRGLIVGLHASMIGFGNVIAGWIGVGFFHVNGQVSWRVPFAIQAVFPLILFILTFLLRESPRWLYMNDRAEEAEQILVKLHQRRDDPHHEFAHREMYIIKEQIEYERITKLPLWQALKQRSLQKRFMIGWLAIWCTQCSGVIVVLAYQSPIYEGLGFSPFVASILGAVWTVMNFTGNFTGGILGDYIGRSRQLVIGLAVNVLLLTALCVCVKVATHGAETGGAVFTLLIAFVYAAFLECPALVYSSEIFPGEWRAFGVSTSISISFLGQLIFTVAAPTALRTIGPYFYVVFIGLTALQLIVAILLFPNTKGFTLEQMSAVFGDVVVDMDGTTKDASDFTKTHHDADTLEIEKVGFEPA